MKSEASTHRLTASGESGLSIAVPILVKQSESTLRVYWTALIGLFFDYYDLFLFIYLEKTLASHFELSASASGWLQFTGLAGVGVGAIAFGYLADRLGRGRMMLLVFGVYVLGIGGLSIAWDYPSLLAFRLIASLALGAEWGISHTYLAERVTGAQRYRLSALLQFSILGGLLAALASKYALPVVGWRWLFALSLVPVAILSVWRWKALGAREAELNGCASIVTEVGPTGNGAKFVVCLALASLTIASGTINIFFVKELPQSVWHTILFWGNVAPGMLFGAWLVRRHGVQRALVAYGLALVALSLAAWSSEWTERKLAFALLLPLLNGIPFGLMGALFNEMFSTYRTMLSGSAYNLGRILAGFSPLLLVGLGLNEGGRYFIFTAVTGAAVVGLAMWLLGAAKTKRA